MKKLKFKKINPERVWKIIVGVFALGLISLSLFAWRIYSSEKIGGGYFAADLPTTENTVQTVDKKRLQKTILLLETRQVTRSKIADPAL